MNYIPLDQCRNGYTYKIRSRNLSAGVFNAEVKGFVGIREKFGHYYLFTEFHRETGAPYGTVSPEAELEKCPLEDIRENLGTFCETCDKPVEFKKENPDGTGDWYHLELTPCQKALPCGKSNRALYQYLEGVTRKVDIGNYIRDLDEYTDLSFFHPHIRYGVHLKLYTEKDLRREFGASFSTVRRWLNGENKPADEMRKSIYDWIKKKAKEHRGEVKEEKPLSP